jgi:hypothetical protein
MNNRHEGASVVTQKFDELVQTMAAAEVERKSSFFPFFKGGIFFLGFLTPLWKRGEGEIFR